MNKTIELLKSHSTIRNFDETYIVSDNDIKEIISSSKQAPSWMNGQAYSITIYKDKDEKKELANLVKKDTIADNVRDKNSEIIEYSSIFLLFNLNLSLYGLENTCNITNEIEPLLLATVDAALALQNATIAAESLGLGTCVVGDIRRISNVIIDTYNYPKFTFPLLGLAIGLPTEKQKVKPRLSDDINVLNPKNVNLPEDLKLKAVNNYGEILEKFANKSNYISSDWQGRFNNYYKDRLWPQPTIKALKKQGILDFENSIV